MPRRFVPPRFSSAVALAVAMSAVPASPLVAASGDLLWEQRSDGSLSCPEPVAMGSRVFTYTTELTKLSTGRPYPVLRAYDLETGKRLWETRDRLGYHSFRYTGWTLAAARGRVFTVADRWTARNAVSVSARDAASGALLWRRDLADDRIQFRVYQVAATAEGVFLVGMREPNPDPKVEPVWTEAMLLALDPRNGSTLWENYVNLAGGPDQAYRLAVDGARVVITIQDWPPGLITGLARNYLVLRAYDAASGELLWQDRKKRTWMGHLTINRNRVFMLTGSDIDPTDAIEEGTRITAYNLDTGERLWQRRTGNLVAYFLAASRRMVAAYGDRFRGSLIDTRIRVYDGETGRLLRRWKDGGGPQNVIADRGQLFVVGSPDHFSEGLLVRAYKLRSGRQLWSHSWVDPDEEELGCTAVVHKGVVVTTSTEFPSEIVRAFER